MSGQGKFFAAAFTLLCALLLILAVGKGLLCGGGAARTGQQAISNVFGDILPADLPAAPEKITGAGVGTAKITLPPDTVGGVIGGPIERPARDVEVELQIFRVDDEIVAPKLVIDGREVELDDWHYEEVETGWSSWRALGPIVADDGDWGAGVGYSTWEPGRWWTGPALGLDMPDFGWVSLGGRVGYHVTDNASIDAGIDYRLHLQEQDSPSNGWHGAIGFSFRL